MLRHNFRIALAYADLNQKAWARRTGLKEANLSHVLSGRAASSRITALIEAFIAEQLPKLRKELNESLTE